jgi:hypothetical protein
MIPFAVRKNRDHFIREYSSEYTPCRTIEHAVCRRMV